MEKESGENIHTHVMGLKPYIFLITFISFHITNRNVLVYVGARSRVLKNADVVQVSTNNNNYYLIHDYHCYTLINHSTSLSVKLISLFSLRIIIK